SVPEVADAAMIPISPHSSSSTSNTRSSLCRSPVLQDKKQPVALVVEVDCLLRPKEKIIVCDNVEIINEMEKALRSMHWKVQLSYSNDMDLKHSHMAFMP
nr:probable methyltransferase PMT26 [Tanacetum cinerariifolium]